MKLFVYGTLKRGYGNHRLMHGAKFLGEAIIEGHVIHDFGGCPGIRPAEKKYHVSGELYEITEDMLPRLDRLEGHYPNSPEDSVYRRTELNAWTFLEGGGSSGAIPCSTYVYNKDCSWAPVCKMDRMLVGEWPNDPR